MSECICPEECPCLSCDRDNEGNCLGYQIMTYGHQRQVVLGHGPATKQGGMSLLGYLVAREIMPALFTRSKCPECGKRHAPIEEHGKSSRKKVEAKK